MAKRPRITITIDEETFQTLERHVRREHRWRGEGARMLFETVVEHFDAVHNARGTDLAEFSRCLTGLERLPTLDPAELRAKSKEAVANLQHALSEAVAANSRIAAALEAEVQAARIAKARRLRTLSVVSEMRS